MFLIEGANFFIDVLICRPVFSRLAAGLLAGASLQQWLSPLKQAPPAPFVGTPAVLCGLPPLLSSRLSSPPVKSPTVLWTPASTTLV